MTTEAPPKFLSSLNKSLAFCLSNKVLPKKVPRPKPEFEFNSNLTKISHYCGLFFDQSFINSFNSLIRLSAD